MQVKLIAGLIAFLAILGGGFYLGYKAAPTPKPIVQIVEKEKIVEVKGEERVVFKDRVVTVVREVIRNPDGTTTERETSTTKEHQQEKETSHTSTERERERVSSNFKLPQYSLGLNLVVPADRIGRQYRPDWKDAEITAGYRVFSNLWTNIQYQPDNRALALGISWQW